MPSTSFTASVEKVPLHLEDRIGIFADAFLIPDERYEEMQSARKNLMHSSSDMLPIVYMVERRDVAFFGFVKPGNFSDDVVYALEAWFLYHRTEEYTVIGILPTVISDSSFRYVPAWV